jgi:quaternary ammonium compound-resistance protein SugE
MPWLLLGIAGVLEIAFAFAMKSSKVSPERYPSDTRAIPALFTIIIGVSSVVLLSLSLRTLPRGTGYAVWTGIGAAGTAVVGIAVPGESAAPLRMLCIVLILAGVIGLRLVSAN